VKEIINKLNKCKCLSITENKSNWSLFLKAMNLKSKLSTQGALEQINGNKLHWQMNIFLMENYCILTLCKRLIYN